MVVDNHTATTRVTRIALTRVASYGRTFITWFAINAITCIRWIAANGIIFLIRVVERIIYVTRVILNELACMVSPMLNVLLLIESPFFLNRLQGIESPALQELLRPVLRGSAAVSTAEKESS